MPVGFSLPGFSVYSWSILDKRNGSAPSHHALNIFNAINKAADIDVICSLISCGPQTKQGQAWNSQALWDKLSCTTIIFHKLQRLFPEQRMSLGSKLQLKAIWKSSWCHLLGSWETAADSIIADDCVSAFISQQYLSAYLIRWQQTFFRVEMSCTCLYLEMMISLRW